jgi:hypothetical protein
VQRRFGARRKRACQDRLIPEVKGQFKDSLARAPCGDERPRFKSADYHGVGTRAYTLSSTRRGQHVTNHGAIRPDKPHHEPSDP